MSNDSDFPEPQMLCPGGYSAASIRYDRTPNPSFDGYRGRIVRDSVMLLKALSAGHDRIVIDKAPGPQFDEALELASLGIAWLFQKRVETPWPKKKGRRKAKGPYRPWRHVVELTSIGRDLIRDLDQESKKMKLVQLTPAAREISPSRFIPLELQSAQTISDAIELLAAIHERAKIGNYMVCPMISIESPLSKAVSALWASLQVRLFIVRDPESGMPVAFVVPMDLSQASEATA